MTETRYEIRITMSVTSEIAAAAFPLELCDRGVLPSTDFILLFLEEWIWNARYSMMSITVS